MPCQAENTAGTRLIRSRVLWLLLLLLLMPLSLLFGRVVLPFPVLGERGREAARVTPLEAADVTPGLAPGAGEDGLELEEERGGGGGGSGGRGAQPSRPAGASAPIPAPIPLSLLVLPSPPLALVSSASPASSVLRPRARRCRRGRLSTRRGGSRGSRSGSRSGGSSGGEGQRRAVRQGRGAAVEARVLCRRRRDADAARRPAAAAAAAAASAPPLLMHQTPLPLLRTLSRLRLSPAPSSGGRSPDDAGLQWW